MNVTKAMLGYFLAMIPVATFAATIEPHCETPVVARADGFHNQGQADDIAIWIHPNDPSQSRIIAAVKGAGLYVYDLECNLVQDDLNPKSNDQLPIRYINNIDLRYNVPWGNQTIDLIVGADEKVRKLFFFAIDGQGHVSLLGSPSENKPAHKLKKIKNFVTHGLCLYQDRITGEVYIYSNQETPGTMTQWQLTNTNQKPTLTQIRQIAFGANTFTEACVVDDQLGYLYIAEEFRGIWKFPALPSEDLKDYKVSSSQVGELLEDATIGGTVLRGSVEGLSIYYGQNGQGYLLANNEGDDSLAIFDRQEPHHYIMTVRSAETTTIDTIQSPDGQDVSNVRLNGHYPSGIFISHDDIDTGGIEGANFKFFSWKDIVDSSSGALSSSTTYNPRAR